MGGQQTAPVVSLTENQPDQLDSAQPPAKVTPLSSVVVQPAAKPGCSTTQDLFPVRNRTMTVYGISLVSFWHGLTFIPPFAQEGPKRIEPPSRVGNSSTRPRSVAVHPPQVEPRSKAPFSPPCLAHLRATGVLIPPDESTPAGKDECTLIAKHWQETEDIPLEILEAYRSHDVEVDHSRPGELAKFKAQTDLRKAAQRVRVSKKNNFLEFLRIFWILKKKI